MSELNSDDLEFQPIFDAHKASIWAMQVTNPNCLTLKELETRVYDFVRYNALQEAAMTQLSDINRRFGQAAGKFGTNSRTIVEHLVVAGRLKIYMGNARGGTQTLLLPMGFVKRMEDSQDPAQFLKALESFKMAALHL